MGAHSVRCTARCIPQLSEIIADAPQWPAVGYASVVRLPDVSTDLPPRDVANNFIETLYRDAERTRFGLRH